MTVEGTIYLIHFDEPLKHAKHYLGWTAGPVEVRIDSHRRGAGSKLMAAVVKAGIEFNVVWTKPGDRNEERRMKNWHKIGRFCPQCRVLNKRG